jgi:hypothetical protein
MAMMMFHAGQPFHSRGSLYGLANQMEFLRRAGAVSAQVTTHAPAVGTRELERTYAGGRVLKRMGSHEVGDVLVDGNHVIVADDRPLWLKQLQLLGGYLAFYNPLNFLRALGGARNPLRFYRAAYQLAGFVGALRTAWKMLPYTLRLAFSKKEFATEAPPVSRVPVRLARGAFARFPDGALYEPSAEEARAAA